MIMGGSLWNLDDAVDMQVYYASLANKVDIPYLENRIIYGEGTEKFKIAVFSDFQCGACSMQIPRLEVGLNAEYFLVGPCST